MQEHNRDYAASSCLWRDPRAACRRLRRRRRSPIRVIRAIRGSASANSPAELGIRLRAYWLVVLAIGVGPQRGSRSSPRPRDVLGFTPGDDYKLADFKQIRGYFETLDAASDRVILTSAGKSTEGRDMLVAVISSEANLAKLERYRDIARRLALVRGAEPTTRRGRWRGKARRLSGSTTACTPARWRRRSTRCCSAGASRPRSRPRCRRSATTSSSCCCRRSTPTASTWWPTGIAARSARRTRTARCRGCTRSTSATTTTATSTCRRRRRRGS